MSQDQINKIFFKPIVKRDEPFVNPTDMIFNGFNENEETQKEIDSAIRNITFVKNSYNILIDDYEKILQVFIVRANMLKLVMKFDLTNLTVVNALFVIYQKQKETLNYEEYLDLLIYEQEVNTQKIKENLDNITPIRPNPYDNAISIIKGLYIDFLKNNNGYDFLQGNIIINKVVEANSIISSANSINELLDGDKLTTLNSSKKDTSKLQQLLEDCIPCSSRISGTALDFKNSFALNSIYQLWLNKFLTDLGYLIRLRIGIVDSYFSKYICMLINAFPFKCVPDLFAIKHLITTIIYKYKKLLDVNFANMSSDALSTGITLVVNPVADTLVTFLIKLMHYIFSPIECILSSLQFQLSKLDINTKIFYDDLRSGYEDVKEWVAGTIQEINRFMKNDVLVSKKIFEVGESLSKFTHYLSIINELINIAKEYKSALDTDLLKKLNKSICAAAFTANKPWYETINKTPKPSDLPIDPPIAFPPNDTPDIPSIIVGLESDDLLIIDKSLPKNFFDNDPIDIVNNKDFQNLYNNRINTTSLEDGDDLFMLDYNLLNRYNKLKQQVKVITNSQEYNNLTSLPVVYLTFTECLQTSGIDNYTEQEINEWINLVK